MRVEDLERELHAARPEVDPDFASKLDEWAAAGFPRGGMLERRVSTRPGGPVRRLEAAVRGRRGRPMRRVLLPVGAAATLIVVVAIGVSQIDGVVDGGGEGLADRELSAGEETSGGQGGVGRLPEPTVDEAAAEASKAYPNASTAELDAGRTSALGEPPTQGGGLARGTEERLEDISARISLGAEAGEVQEVANGVVEVTDRYEGFVLNSQVTSDQAGARATFELEIPAAKLDDALADLSSLGDVISRTEASEDITAAAVRARKDLAETLDRIHDLRIELIEADTFEERRIIRLQIRSLDAQADAFETQLNQVKRQARFATVAVDVTSNGPSTGDGNWDLGDAVDDAGEVLTTIGGIALIALAVAVPVALVTALAYWLFSVARRRSRERTLDS